MVSRYSNELNSFRNGIEDRVAQHRDKISAVNQALGIKADKVFENAKKISDIGSKLTESGIGGGVGATALSKYARKGITKFNQFKQDAADKVKGLADKAESKVQEAGSKVEGKVGDLQDAAGNAETQVRQTAQSAQSGAEQSAQTARNSVVSESNTGGATQRVGATTEEGVGDTIEPRSLDQNTEYEYGGDQAEAMRIRDAGGEGGRLPEDGGGETKGEDLVDEPSPSSGAGVGNSGDVEMNTISNNTTTASTAEEATTESSLLGGAEELEEGAAATSWLGFLGVPELLAGLGAIAGVAAAGVGIADAVKGGAGEAQAQAMRTKVKDTGFQAAGTYVVPTMDSIS